MPLFVVTLDCFSTSCHRQEPVRGVVDVRWTPALSMDYLLSCLSLHEVTHMERESALQALCSLLSECEVLVVNWLHIVYKNM